MHSSSEMWSIRRCSPTNRASISLASASTIARACMMPSVCRCVGRVDAGCHVLGFRLRPIGDPPNGAAQAPQDESFGRSHSVPRPAGGSAMLTLLRVRRPARLRRRPKLSGASRPGGNASELRWRKIEGKHRGCALSVFGRVAQQRKRSSAQRIRHLIHPVEALFEQPGVQFEKGYAGIHRGMKRPFPVRCRWNPSAGRRREAGPGEIVEDDRRGRQQGGSASQDRRDRLGSSGYWFGGLCNRERP
jgi:hypothetical protein